MKRRGVVGFALVESRVIMATKPGMYRIGFTAVDTFTNGPAGGPIHAASDELAVWFQAGVNVQSVDPDPEDGHVHVRFGATAGYS